MAGRKNISTWHGIGGDETVGDDTFWIRLTDPSTGDIASILIGISETASRLLTDGSAGRLSGEELNLFNRSLQSISQSLTGLGGERLRNLLSDGFEFGWVDTTTPIGSDCESEDEAPGK